MEKCFDSDNWKDYIPLPVCEEFIKYEELYLKAWELARSHVKKIPGMPQSPYMDEAFCDTQIWIWDTCFMALFCKYAQQVFPGIESFANFYDVLYRGKRLPRIIPSDKEPLWTGATHGVPFGIEIHIADNPPLFAWAEYENALFHGNSEYVKELLYDKGYLQKHYEWIEGLTKKCRLKGVHAETCLIREKNGYRWEGGRSGMDNTPRGRTQSHAESERPNNQNMLWVDAICQQALSAKMISELFKLIGDMDGFEKWNEKYFKKRDLVNRLYWDIFDNFYYDIDCKTGEFYKVKTIASFWALTSRIPTSEQAAKMVEHVIDPLNFGGEPPLTSLSKSDADYDPNGNYWRGSLWLPTAYAALRGLSEYGYHKEAREAAVRILDHIFKTYLEYEPHTIWEAYAPAKFAPATNETGTKTVRPDFCGWSALGPISMYIEHVLGFYKIDAFENTVFWDIPNCYSGEIGIKNLRFGSVITDIIFDGEQMKVISNAPYTLKIKERTINVRKGTYIFKL